MDIPPVPALFMVYGGLNILAFAVFSSDKFRSIAGMGRTPENILLLVAVPGPFGALAAMLGFRHKIRHVKFFLVPVFALLHMVLSVWLWQYIF